jgi:ParB family chromosome partitioning protein
MSLFDDVLKVSEEEGLPLDGMVFDQEDARAKSDPRMVRITDVTVADGRREVSEEWVERLMESMQEVGLINPITVTPTLRLVAGAHRLEAGRRLGWTDIEVVIRPIDALRADLAMIDENLVRNELGAMERGEALQRRKTIYEALHPEVKQGGAPGKSGGGKVAKTAEHASFASDTAAKTGMSVRTIQTETQIAKKLPKELRDRIRRSELARNKAELLKLSRIRNQEEQREIAVAVMDGKAKNVDDAMRRRRLRLRHEEIAQKNAEAAKLEAGEGALAYGVILADVPWMYRHPISKSRDIEANYETMPAEEIAEIPVLDIAAQDAVLFFWCPAAKIAEAVDIVRRWGFDVRSSMVWDKGHIGPGVWARIQHEIILICVRGNPPQPEGANKPESIIRAPRGEHSEKPVQLYEVIEKAWPTMTKVELFARQRRDGWRSLGMEIDGTDISVAIASIKQRAGMSMEPRVPRADGLPSSVEPAQDSQTAPPSPPVVEEEGTP